MAVGLTAFKYQTMRVKRELNATINDSRDQTGVRSLHNDENALSTFSPGSFIWHPTCTLIKSSSLPVDYVSSTEAARTTYRGNKFISRKTCMQRDG